MSLLSRLISSLAVVLCSTIICVAQRPPDSAAGAQEVQDLRTELASMRSDLQQCKQELSELREQMRALQERLGTQSPSPSGAAPTTANQQFPTLADINKEPVAQAETQPSDQELVAAKVAEYEQTKVESASKYKVRLSGLVLMNAFSNIGNVDITDLPNLAFHRAAVATSGNSGATVRQTTLGLQVTGPTIAGARTSADVDFDFYGGIPATSYGTTMGLARLRTARARFDWRNWSIIAGQDTLFFSPLSPTSYATLAEPAFSWSGNLWVWQPQIRAERRWTVSEKSNVTWGFGLLDTVSEERPDATFNRRPDPAEAGRVPGVGTHISWNGATLGQPATLGLGGYYGRQNWPFQRAIDSWLVSGDFNLPISRTLALSGEIYRGQAIGGFGGGIWTSALFDGDPDVAGTHILPLNDIGGWSQLKFQPLAKLEFNAAAGAANPLSHDLEFFAKPRNYAFTPLARNQTLLFNSIYRVRSNVVLALEYRHLRTYALSGTKNSADHINFSIGVSF
jgi:hypothetical protein